MAAVNKAHCCSKNIPLCFHHSKECDLVCIECETKKIKFVNVCHRCIEEDHDGHKLRSWKKATAEEIVSQINELKISRHSAENMLMKAREIFGKRRPPEINSLEKLFGIVRYLSLIAPPRRG